MSPRDVEYYPIFTNDSQDSRMIPNQEALVPTRTPRKLVRRSPLANGSEILDVPMTAELLTVSTDTVYDLFKTGDLPARKVGRTWLTTRSAVLRWIEHASEQETLARAIERGDANALAAALTNGQVRVKKRA